MKHEEANCRLWSFSYTDFLREFKLGAASLGSPSTVPYMMRHSGPSIDRAQQARPMLEVQRRGQWRSTRSLDRYEKVARVAKSFTDLPMASQLHLTECERRVEDILWCGRTIAPPRLPITPGAASTWVTSFAGRAESVRRW